MEGVPLDARLEGPHRVNYNIGTGVGCMEEAVGDPDLAMERSS